MIRGKPIRTTVSDKVNRQFHAPAPNRLWVSDFTYGATWAGFVYVAFVIDAYVRRIVGWRVKPMPALFSMLWNKHFMRGDPVHRGGLIHHSDRGSRGGFNRSSQHVQFDWPASTGPELRREFSIRGSCGAVY